MFTRAHFDRLRRSRSLSLFMLVVLSLLAVLSVSGGVALAQEQRSHASSAAFSTQERIGFPSGDDWEPAITADRYGHIYTMYKHYNVPTGQTCSGCDLHLLVQRSSDGGRTWSKPKPIAPGAVKGGQYDSQIMVDPVDGRTIWASFLQNTNSLIAVARSTDFGETWSEPRIVSDRPPGLDKDELAVRGQTIAVAYDDNFNTFASVSLDGGKHWATHKVFPTSDRFSISLAAGAGIDSQGNIFVSWDSFDKAHRNNGDGPATVWVSKSSDNGQHWTRTVIDVSGAAPLCNPCGFAYLSSQMALRIGSDDTIYLLWNGTTTVKNFAPERIFFSRSTDHGVSYSQRTQISDAPAGSEHCFPYLAVGQSAADVRLGWMDTRTGKWNVFYRTSTDWGQTFGPVLRISNFVPGYPYLSKAGFNLPYGDYFEMTVDDHNNTQMAFGEGPSYAGPGNIWVSHQTSSAVA